MSQQAEIESRSTSVLGTTMAWRQTGAHDAPVALFLHGNPTSSHIWRWYRRSRIALRPT